MKNYYHISKRAKNYCVLGVADEIASAEGVPIVDSLILIYCKTFFGFKNDGSVKEIPKSFEMLVKQIALTKGSAS